ncbi:MAG TPA: hypothetical protein VK914_11295 [bacterium]|jgi:hypothetical protein|nr:hypothetical protein [bacterium]
MQSTDPRGQNSNAYWMTAIAGLLILALHSMGLGLIDPSMVLKAQSLAYAFPETWPYLALALGILAQRRWARDLASATAFLALVAALAAFPRTLFLDLGYGLAAAHPAQRAPWLVFKPLLEQQAVFAVLCAGTLYALTRPSLVVRCESGPKQPAWTENLGFAALLLLSRQFFAAGEALNLALYKFPEWSSGAMAALALTALVGLWQRRWWGWAAMAIQTLLLVTRPGLAALSKATLSYYQFQDKAPSAAVLLACEAFCRSLPDLAVQACLLVALLKSRRQFGR